jgi:hypothetical protein
MPELSDDEIAKKTNDSYPEKPFKINQVSVIWAKAGSSLLQIASENNISLYNTQGESGCWQFQN